MSHDCPYCGAKPGEMHNPSCVALKVLPEPMFKTEAGVKHDGDKPRPSLVLDSFANALAEVTAVATFGARKYTDDGWVSVPDGVRRYKDALYRHLMAEAQGEWVDPESECLHLAHAAWNILAVLELKLRG